MLVHGVSEDKLRVRQYEEWVRGACASCLDLPFSVPPPHSMADRLSLSGSVKDTEVAGRNLCCQLGADGPRIRRREREARQCARL